MWKYLFIPLLQFSENFSTDFNNWIHIGLCFCMFLQFIKIISALQCNSKSKILIHQLSCWSFHFLSFSSLSGWATFFFFIFLTTVDLIKVSRWCLGDSYVSQMSQYLSGFSFTFSTEPIMPSQYFDHFMPWCHVAWGLLLPHFLFSQFTVKLLEEFDTVLTFRRISHSWANLAWNTKPCSPNPKISIKSKKSTYSDVLKRIQTHFLGNNTKNILQYWPLHILPEVTVMCKYPSRFLHNKSK